MNHVDIDREAIDTFNKGLLEHIKQERLPFLEFANEVLDR